MHIKNYYLSLMEPQCIAQKTCRSGSTLNKIVDSGETEVAFNVVV